MTGGADHRFHRRCEGGVELFVRLTPKSSRDEVEGVERSADGRAHLKARVRAVPEKGKANQALVRLLADTLRLPVRDLAVVAGETARLKTVRIAGDADAAEAALALLDG